MPVSVVLCQSCAALRHDRAAPRGTAAAKAGILESRCDPDQTRGVGDTGAKRTQESPPARGSPSWTLSRGAASGLLTLRFVGPTATSDIPDFLAALTQNMPPRDAHIIFDLSELQGHNLDTRAPIQRWLRENRSRIAQVTVLVKKAATILKMATSVVALATGMKIEIRDKLGSESAAHRIRR